jgi:DNA-binding NarL/FixJ family response regulator
VEKRERRFLAAVQDIFFAAKITAAAKRVGVNVDFIREEEKLLQAAASSPSVVIIDLNNFGLNWAELVRKLKAASPDGGVQDVQIIAYLSHVQRDLMREAQKAGCDLVLPRSVFSQQLDDLLRQRSCHLDECP